MKRILLFVLIFLFGFANVNASAEIKTISGIVSEITSEYVIFKTDDGNGWVIDFENGFRIGERVLITFDDLESESIYDDEIVSIEW